ncbi:MAG: signal peptide protein [Phycisphaerales bacterium]|nr:signal peptide protein [Phycisphaerales bacterium]
MNRRRPAFTMIELLVVIGIIVVLIGLLIPVITKVKTTANTANVTNQMHRISAAIGNYFNDFQAYPGALGNREFTGSGSSPRPFTPAKGTYTPSEDLYMALLGGFQINTSTRALSFVPAEIGLGPANFNLAAVMPRKHAYSERIPAESTPPLNGAQVPIREVTDLELSYPTDSEIPEFIDLYPLRRPILYLRENAGATAAVFYSSQATGSFNSTAHYDVSGLEPYLKGPRDSLTNNDFHDPKETKNLPSGEGIKSDGHLDLSKQWVIDYFTNKLGSGSGSGAKSGYLLIDAGPDRMFGTDDDIVVSAGGGQ